MAEGNGEQPNLSRLERIEAALELFIGDHERFRVEHERFVTRQEMLTRSQESLQESVVLLQDSQVRLHDSQVRLHDSQIRLNDSLQNLEVHVAEIGDKLDGLIDVVDRDHSEFHARLSRLEGKQ